MKPLYSFEVKCEDKPVEVFFAKPSYSSIEDSEYVFAQYFNKLIKDGFLSRAMMHKQFGDIGGIYSEKSTKELGESINEILECKRTIEFYGNAENLTDEQKKKLEDSKETFAVLQKQIVENDLNLKQMFAQSADTKAEEYISKWFALNFSYYYEKVEDKKEAFKIFDESDISKKKEQLNLFLEEIEDTDDSSLKFKKNLTVAAFPTLSKVISIWYNGLGNNQEEVQSSLEKFFPEDFPASQSSKTVAKRKNAKRKTAPKKE